MSMFSKIAAALVFISIVFVGIACLATTIGECYGVNPPRFKLKRCSGCLNLGFCDFPLYDCETTAERCALYPDKPTHILTIHRLQLGNCGGPGNKLCWACKGKRWCVEHALYKDIEGEENECDASPCERIYKGTNDTNQCKGQIFDYEP